MHESKSFKLVAIKLEEIELQVSSNATSNQTLTSRLFSFQLEGISFPTRSFELKRIVDSVMLHEFTNFSSFGIMNFHCSHF